ncbi:hypothetical protein [Bacillus cereus]|uniref:hypothetical protein n=1 Tax=Bacillus cereus TaxID=1396 RepID=UPI0014837F5D|nr:hypothetical protein [Bacillus cereus]
MEVIYTKWHNNCDELTLGQKYKASLYKKGWLLIETGYLYSAFYSWVKIEEGGEIKNR